MRRGGPEYRSQEQQDIEERGYGDENIGIEECLDGLPWRLFQSPHYRQEAVGILSKAAREARNGIHL
jgi:hypothetical protein